MMGKLVGFTYSIEIIKVTANKALVAQLGTDWGVLKLSEPGERIVIKVVCILEDTPRYTGVLVVFRGRLP